MNSVTVEQNGLHNIKRKLAMVPPVVWMLAVMLVVFSVIDTNYFSLQNLQNIVIQSVPLLILAIGQTFIVLTQGTDLSLGSQVSFTTVIWVWLATKEVPLAVGAIIALTLTTLIGTINGLLVGRGRLMPFIATLAMQNVLNSVSLLITDGSSVYYHSELFNAFYSGSLWVIPYPLIVTVLVFVSAWLLLYHTKFGTNVFALGGNREALSLAGVSPAISLIKTYAFVGLIAGIAGLVTACRVESGQPNVGVGWEFDAVAATLLGGSSMREGKGGIVGTVFGVLFIKVLQNGLNVLGVNTLYHNAAIGIIVLIAIVADALIRNLKQSD